MEANFLYNPSGIGNHAHGATLMETSQGHLLCSWFGYPGDHDYEKGKLILARKDAGSSDWNKSVAILSDLDSSAGNPILYEDPSDGKIWILFFLIRGNYFTDSIVYRSYSIDGGHSWASPTQVWDQKGMMVRHSPVEQQKGVFLLPSYDERSKTSHLHQLRPGSQRWERYHSFEGEVIQPTLTRVNEMKLMCFFRPTGSNRIVWRAHSSDNGKSWSNLIRTKLPCPLAAVSSFADGDSVYLVYNHTEAHQRYPLSISKSDNGGVSWTEPWHIDKSNHEVSYPHFILGSDDSIHGVYTFNRRMIKYVHFSKEEVNDAIG